MKTILVVGNTEDVRTIVTEALRFSGFGTLSAEDGDIAVKLAREHIPDLIICGTSMPRMNGYATLTALRHDAATASIPFIFLTGATDRRDMRKGMELGADDYLTMPFTYEELMAAVEVRLKRRAQLEPDFGQAGAKTYPDREELVQSCRELSRTVSLRILVVDDVPEVADLYEAIIHFGAEQAIVLKIQDGTEAWQELLRADPDLLIMDISRPRMDGLTTLQLLAERKVQYPIAVASGMLPGIEEEARACAGPNLNVTFLPKVSDRFVEELLSVLFDSLRLRPRCSCS